MQHKQINRRRFLLTTTGSILAAASTTNMQPMADETQPFQTTRSETPQDIPAESLFRQQVRSVPLIDTATWTLEIGGLVGRPLHLSYASLRALASVEVACTLACIGSSPQSPLIGHARWQGVPLQTLSEQAVIHPQAQFARMFSADGYVTSVRLEGLKNALLALGMDGEPLAPEHGYPARVIVPGLYGYKMPKWLTAIQFTPEPINGFWEGRGWSAEGIVQTASYIFSPRHLQPVSGLVEIAGVAFAGERRITQVEVSIDDAPWMPVNISPAEAFSWTRWHITWQPPSVGDYLVKVRAGDDSGFIQPDGAAGSGFPNGSTAIQSIIIRVEAI